MSWMATVELPFPSCNLLPSYIIRWIKVVIFWPARNLGILRVSWNRTHGQQQKRCHLSPFPLPQYSAFLLLFLLFLASGLAISNSKDSLSRMISLCPRDWACVQSGAVMVKSARTSHFSFPLVLFSLCLQ